MCFGSSPDGPQTNPAPYSLENSHTAVEKTQGPASPFQAETKPAAKETASVTPLVNSGLNVQGM